MGSWFPRPDDLAGIEVFDSSRDLGQEMLFNMLRAPQAVELPEKVGVTGASDGSAKKTTRLLVSGPWIFKANMDNAFRKIKDAVSWIQGNVALQNSIKAWHPSKQWFCLKLEKKWMPVSACHRLKTLREVSGLQAKLDMWGKMIDFALTATDSKLICLDLNPSNFGLCSESGSLYYLDDEILDGPAGEEYLASVLASRIQEEGDTDHSRWHAWGKDLGSTLSKHFAKSLKLNTLVKLLIEYPLPALFEVNLLALANGLQAVTAQPVFYKSGLPRRTLVFGDIHGNFPALQKVLEKAETWGVNQYLFLGDVVGYGPFPKECIETVANLPNAVLVMGNHDFIVGKGEVDLDTNRHAKHTHAWTIDHLTEAEQQWLLSLKRDHFGGDWLAVHGAPIDKQRFYAYVYELTYKSNLEFLQKEKISFCFYGHTHVPFVHSLDSDDNYEKFVPSVYSLDSKTRVSLINPGSVGQPRNGDWRASFAIWDHENDRLSFHRVDYPVDAVIRAIEKIGFPEDLGHRLTIGR